MAHMTLDVDGILSESFTITGLDISYGETKSLYSLILEQTSQGKLKNGTELFVVSCCYVRL